MAKKKKSRFAGKTTSNAKKQQNQGSSYGYLKLPKGVNIFKEEPGRTTLDIIPYEVTISNHPDLDEQDQIALKGDLWYKLPFKIHRNIGLKKDSVVCPRTFGKKCPICEYREKRFKEGADKEETDSLKASTRNLYAVIVKSSKEEQKVKIWDISQYLFQNLLNAELEEDEDNGVFPDLEDGMSLKIRFDEKQLGKNKFAEASRIDFISRKEQYTEDILEEVPNLDEMLTIHSYDVLEKMFLELEEPEVDADDDDEEAPKKPARRKAKPEPEPEDEEDDDEYDDDEDDDDDEEPAPPVKTRRSKKAPEPEPEDEDDDDDEDEEEEPKPKRRKAKVEDDDDEEEDEPKPKRGKSSKKDKCPYGHKFGKDCEKFEDCDSCELWDECIEAQEADN